MTDSGNHAVGRLRVLVVAQQPFRLADLTPVGGDSSYDARLIRRPSTLPDVLDEFEPDVAVVDTSYGDGVGFAVIGEVLARAPGTGVLALTPDPPPHDHVALATRAGASGFIGVNAEPAEFAAAIEAASEGRDWLPAAETRQVLSAVADDLDTTAAERRSRLTNILLGLIPITGAIAAMLALFWRRYLGQIGVRPVDLAVDPATRVVDAIAALLFIVGFFGPLLLVGSWLDAVRASAANRGGLAWFLERRKTAHALVSVVWLVAAVLLTMGPDLILVLVVGPVMTVALLAKVLDLSDELPRVLRIERVSPRRALAGGLAALLMFIGVLGVEALLVGPDLRTDGEHGILAPTVLGFNAQPMRAFDVDAGGEPREVLYLGGNADLYVLVDPCNDDEVEYVSVGSTRLVVIDEVTCPPDNS